MSGTHGGRRTPGPGKRIGRPPMAGGKRETMAFSLSPAVAEYLRAQANQSAFVDALVRRTNAFKEAQS